MEVLSETEDKMRWSTNKRLHLEMGLIKAVHTLAEASISDIIMALEGAPLATAAPASSSDPASQQEPSTFISSATAPTPAPRPNILSPVACNKTNPSYRTTFDGSDFQIFLCPPLPHLPQYRKFRALTLKLLPILRRKPNHNRKLLHPCTAPLSCRCKGRISLLSH